MNTGKIYSNFTSLYRALGVQFNSQTDREVIAECPFCGKDKLYISAVSGMWSCKSGACGLQGNVYTFMNVWLKLKRGETDYTDYETLSKDRGISAHTLEANGLAFDSRKNRWMIPILNQAGKLVNMRSYTPGRKLYNLPVLKTYLWGLDSLEAGRIYLCEGEWDRLALLELGAKNVLAAPGASIFKDEWVWIFKNREVAVLYDHDDAGSKGAARVIAKILQTASSIAVLKWPKSKPDGYDVRDYLIDGGKLGWIIDNLKFAPRPGPDSLGGKDSLGKKKVPSISTSTKHAAGGLGDEIELYREADDKPKLQKLGVAYPDLCRGGRPNFQEILVKYRQDLYMLPEMEDALRVVYAVVLTASMGGDPLWVHVVAPPGGGKTELIMSISETDMCITRSTITPASLVSGFREKGMPDPSLLPDLFGKTFVLKDFTEIIRMPDIQKQILFSILRGAYDGVVERAFGNIGSVKYEGFFNLVSGVTPAIFGESTALLGERFLLFYMNNMTWTDNSNVVASAIRNVGMESDIRSRLCKAANSFLEYNITESDIPEMSTEMEHKLVGLSQLVALLRGTVEKDKLDNYVPYRPRTEVATRIAKQLKKLAIGLGLINTPPVITDSDFKIVQRVAMNTCIGWNVDTVRTLVAISDMTLDEIAESANIPKSTLREHLEQLCMLGVIQKDMIPNAGGRGAPMAQYRLSKQVISCWRQAGLGEIKSASTGKPEVSKVDGENIKRVSRIMAIRQSERE